MNKTDPDEHRRRMLGDIICLVIAVAVGWLLCSANRMAAEAAAPAPIRPSQSMEVRTEKKDYYEGMDDYPIKPKLVWKSGRVAIHAMEYEGDKFLLIETFYDGHTTVKDLPDDQ
jgi:hypothetical protein